MMFVMEPLKKNDDILRPLTRAEVGVINDCLGFFLEQFNGAKLDSETKRSLEWVRRLHLRFERLEQGKGFLRPRR
jgi:hypothetical protein